MKILLKRLHLDGTSTQDFIHKLKLRTENSLNSISESTCGTIEEVSFEWSYHRISSTDIESFESSAEEVLFEW